MIDLVPHDCALRGNLMPDRIIRDELLTSERYWSCSIQAQQLYVHLLLVVDDAARFSGKNFSIRAACFPGRPLEPLAMEKMLLELADADMIRPYMVGSERFIFVPRFRNRRRYVSASKYPAPPNEINDLPLAKADLSQPEVNPKSGGVGVGVGEGKDLEASPLVPVAAQQGRIPRCPTDEILKSFHRHLPMLPSVVVLNASRKSAIASRWREVVTTDKMDLQAGLEWFDWYFAHVAKSLFLTGRTKSRDGRVWRADLDWLLKPINFAKTVEGNYHKEPA